VAKRLGELLIEAKVITQEQLDQALTVQRGGSGGRKLGQLLTELEMVTETQLTQALGRQLSVPWVTLYHVEFSRSLLNFVPKELAEKYNLVPVHVRKSKKSGEELFVAMDDPTNEAALAEVAKTAGIPVKPMIACPTDVKSAIRVYYGGGAPEDSQPQIAAEAQGAGAKKPVPPRSSSTPDVNDAAAAAAPTERQKQPTQPDVEPPPSSRDEIEVPPYGEDDDHPDAEPEIEATEIERTLRKKGPRMVALTLLDGTTIRVPAAGKKRASQPDEGEKGEKGEKVENGGEKEEGKGPSNEQLTARDLVSALRAVAHGADATEILGERPPGWEAMFATLLSLMLKKGLIADWEFIEEYRKI
jgi:type IV pilus assembly protein PilB